MLSRSKPQTAYAFFRKLYKLTLGGGIVFWVTSIATSLLPIAAQYRAHFTNWKPQTVWVASLFMGMIIGCCVSYSLLRLMQQNPTKHPIQESTLLSFIALVIAIILIDVPQSFLLPGSRDALDYFLIGVIFNAVRFLVLGIVIGYLYKRLYGSASARGVGISLPG
jgi:NhaP-type Na+/H+ or K+/H+ antiporter